MMRAIWCVFALCVLPIWAAAAPNQAATGTAAMDATLEAAHGHFQAKRPGEALALLDQVLAQSQSLPGYQARIQFFRARCLISLHRPDEARSALERFIAQSTSKADRDRGRAWLAKVQRRFYGAIRVVCTDGKLRVALKGAKGQPRRCPAQWTDLRPGKYRVTVTGGPAPKSLSLEVMAGQVLTQDLSSGRAAHTALPKPPTMALAWGVFARGGLAMPRGTTAELVEVTGGLSAEAGAWTTLLWPVEALHLGVRFELGYRLWSVTTEQAGNRSTLQTHDLIVPVLAQLDLPAGLSLRLGPVLGLVMAASADDGEPATQPLSLSGVAEAAWRLPVDAVRLSLAMRYTLELAAPFEHADLRRDQLHGGLELGF